MSSYLHTMIKVVVLEAGPTQPTESFLTAAEMDEMKQMDVFSARDDPDQLYAIRLLYYPVELEMDALDCDHRNTLLLEYVSHYVGDYIDASDLVRLNIAYLAQFDKDEQPHAYGLNDFKQDFTGDPVDLSTSLRMRWVASIAHTLLYYARFGWRRHRLFGSV